MSSVRIQVPGNFQKNPGESAHSRYTRGACVLAFAVDMYTKLYAPFHTRGKLNWPICIDQLSKRDRPLANFLSKYEHYRISTLAASNFE